MVESNFDVGWDNDSERERRPAVKETRELLRDERAEILLP